MKTFALAIMASIVAISAAHADDAQRSAKAQWIFPPVTQTIGYTYAKPLIAPKSSPAKGTLAEASAERITPPITALLGETHSHPVSVQR